MDIDFSCCHMMNELIKDISLIGFFYAEFLWFYSIIDIVHMVFLSSDQLEFDSERWWRWGIVQCLCPDKSPLHRWYFSGEFWRNHTAKFVYPRRDRFVSISSRYFHHILIDASYPCQDALAYYVVCVAYL